MDEDSIEHIVTRRLDSLFAEDGEDRAEVAPQAQAQGEASPLRPLAEATEALRSGIDPPRVERLSSEIRTLRTHREDDPLYRPLLKMLGMLADYLDAALQSAHEDALPKVDSIIDCMAYLEPEKGSPDIDKRRRVHKEIESFKAFRSRIQAGKRAGTSQPKPESEPPAAASPPEAEQPPAAPEPRAVPRTGRPPDPVPAEEDAGARRGAAVPPDTGGLRESVAALDTRTGNILRALQDQASLNKELRDALAGMGTRLEDLASLPAAVRSLQKAVEDIPAPQPVPREDLQSCVQGAVDELSGGLDEVRGMPAGLREMRLAMDEGFSRLEERMKYLRGEINAIRADIGSLRSELENLDDLTESRESPAPLQAGEPGEEDRVSGRAPGLAREEPGPALESREESTREPPPLSSEGKPGEATWTYFVFQAGGKKYAVEERYVVKSSKSPGGLLKKARNRGGLTLAESTPGLFSARKGLEPAWDDITSTDWKQTSFQLVPATALEGLDGTSGEGVLFLGAGKERYVLFTDRPAEKITLGHEDEVQMAGGVGTDCGPTCGSILRPGDGSEFYLILDPARL